MKNILLKNIFFLLLPSFVFAKQPDMKKIYGVYWGTFDPPTLAHKAIIVQSLISIPLEALYVVINNDGKKRYSFNILHRKQMIQKMLFSYPKLKNKIIILHQNDKHSFDYVKLKKMLNGKLYAIAGYDAYTSWSNYIPQSKRKMYDGIVVVPRNNEAPKLFDKNAFLLKIDCQYQFVSSSHLKKSQEDLNKHIDEKIIKDVQLKLAYE